MYFCQSMDIYGSIANIVTAKYEWNNKIQLSYIILYVGCGVIYVVLYIERKKNGFELL